MTVKLGGADIRALPSLDEILAVLADPTRRAIVDELARHPMRSGELAARTGSSPSTVSRHLQMLRRLGVVEERHDSDDARVRLYTLRTEPLRELADWIEETQSFWRGQLASFREHIDRNSR